MDEFALCWNNFQDNIATGFQSLYDRGDLVDVTLACDGKLLKAHKIVLAICSPYFQEMFITNPCKHPIIVLKDVTVSVMSELLQFMYQGEVNVKHTELQSFMKIAETLQIKGLTTSQKTHSPHHQSGNSSNTKNTNSSLGENQQLNASSNIIETKINSVSATFSPTSSKSSENMNILGQKRPPNEYVNSDLYPAYPKKQNKRSSDINDHDMNSDSIDNMTSDEVFIPAVPQISMIEPQRFDLTNVKRENIDSMPHSPNNNMRTLSSAHHMHPGFIFEHNNGNYSGGGKSMEYPNDLNFPNEYSKGAGHMEIPAGTNITMLSSTSLLHGNCIFNRNNTVATQQGLKTYWLCKSYRITMCRARCITHQGRVISATGVHNHPPHMKSAPEYMQPTLNNLNCGNVRPQQHIAEDVHPPPLPSNSSAYTHDKVQTIEQQTSNETIPPHEPPQQMIQHDPNNSLHSMMQNVLNPNNLHIHHGYLNHSGQILQPIIQQQHHQQHSNMHHVSPTTINNTSPNSNSQSSRSSSTIQPQESPNIVQSHTHLSHNVVSTNQSHVVRANNNLQQMTSASGIESNVIAAAPPEPNQMKIEHI